MQAEATVTTSNKLHYADLSAEQRLSVDGLYQNMLLAAGPVLDRLRECNNKQVSLGDVRDSWITLGSECGLYYVRLENVVSIDLGRVKASIKQFRINLIYDLPDYYLCMEIPKPQIPSSSGGGGGGSGKFLGLSADMWIAMVLFAVVCYFVFVEDAREKLMLLLTGKYLH